MGSLLCRKQEESESETMPKCPPQKRRYQPPPNITVQQTNIPEEIMSFILEDPMFNCEESELESRGFEKCIDYPKLPGHIYYEGYFHSLETGDPVLSMNPRTGMNMDKPAASKRLRAFIVEFRKANWDWIDLITERMTSANETMAGLFLNGWALGDLAIQVHYGDHVGGDNLGWHVDAPNSVLHMALSLRGKRKLHSEIKGGPPFEDTVFSLSPGEVYLSSPTRFRHAVEYPKCTWENRVVAVQCRVLMRFEDYGRMMGKEFMVDVVTEVLKNADIRMPSFDDVKLTFSKM